MNTFETQMPLKAALEGYQRELDAWRGAAKKQATAVNKLYKAVETGKVRDIEKLRQEAQQAAEVAVEEARICESFDFNIENYLHDGYSDELLKAAEDAGVDVFERDGKLFSYPVLVDLEPGRLAVRIDKSLHADIHPDRIAGVLKKAQSREPRTNPNNIINMLFRGYELVRAEAGMDSYTDILLREIYKVLTILPGSKSEYTLLDFTRDLYFLDISGVTETRRGYRLNWAASTISRESSKDMLTFVTRDGHEKKYAAVKFTPKLS